MRFSCLVVSVAFLSAAAPARATDYRNDLNLSRLYTFPGYRTDADRNDAYRSLMSQLGMALAPQYHSPAETVGFSGFALAAKYGFTSIDRNADYWENGLNRKPDPMLHTLTLEARKGLWFPIPSFELGAGFTYLTDSRLFVLNASAKFALHEGFLHWPTPALAARFTGQRVVGTDQVDITILGFDVSISKSFGVGGVINMTPYVGYSVLWIIADSQVIDTTPGVDSLQCSVDPAANGCSGGETPSFTNTPYPPGQFCTSGDCGNNYVFDNQDAILRHRIFVGLRMIYYHFVLTLEATWALKGNSKDTLAFNGASITDRAKFQQTYSFSVGWDY